MHQPGPAGVDSRDARAVDVARIALGARIRQGARLRDLLPRIVLLAAAEEALIEEAS